MYDIIRNGGMNSGYVSSHNSLDEAINEADYLHKTYGEEFSVYCDRDDTEVYNTNHKECYLFNEDGEFVGTIYDVEIAKKFCEEMKKNNMNFYYEENLGVTE